VTLRVIFTPEAEQQLVELYRYIAAAASPDVAAHFTDAIVEFCEGLSQFPHRGVARDDIRPGLRTIAYRKRTIIAFAIMDDTIAIVGVFYGGRDYATLLADSDLDE
jgi:plasmid stabilization system protein ParE